MQGMPTLSTTPGPVPSDDEIATGRPLMVSFDLTVLEDSVLGVCVGRTVTFVSAETADTSVRLSAERLRLRPGGAPRIVEVPSLFADKTELVGVSSSIDPLASSLAGSLAVSLAVSLVDSLAVSVVVALVGSFGSGFWGTGGLTFGFGVVAFSLPLRDAVLRFRVTTRTSGLGDGCAFSFPFTTLRILGALLATLDAVSFGTGGLGALSIRFRSVGALEIVEMVDRTDRIEA